MKRPYTIIIDDPVEQGPLPTPYQRMYTDADKVPLGRLLVFRDGNQTVVGRATARARSGEWSFLHVEALLEEDDDGLTYEATGRRTFSTAPHKRISATPVGHPLRRVCAALERSR